MVNHSLLNNRVRGLCCKIPDGGMKFLLYGPSLWARSTNQKFQPEYQNFTVKPEQTRLLICLLYGFRQAKRAKQRELLHCLHFLSQFCQNNKIQKRNHQNSQIRVLFNFSPFQRSFFSRSHKVRWFCKQKPWC